MDSSVAFPSTGTPGDVRDHVGEGEVVIPSAPSHRPIRVHFSPSTGITGSLATLAMVGLNSIYAHLHLSCATCPTVETLVDDPK